MMYYFIMILSVFIASISQLLLKISANKPHKTIKQEYLNPLVIGGYLLLIVSTLLTILAYRGIAYTSGPIIETLGYVFILIFSWLILKEKLSWNVILGNIIIIVGIIIFYI